MPSIVNSNDTLEAWPPSKKMMKLFSILSFFYNQTIDLDIFINHVFVYFD